MPRKPTVATASTTKIILVLPCEGTPYIWKNKVFNIKNKEELSSLSKDVGTIVGGEVERGDTNMLRIHPSFGNRWRIADALRQKEGVNMYLNGNGMLEGLPNMACMRMVRDVPNGKGISYEDYMKAPLRVARAPYFGDVALVMPLITLKEEIDPEAMKLVRVEDYYKELGFDEPETPSTDEDYEKCLGGYVFEPYDGQQAKAFKEFATSKDWHLASFGRVYKKKTGRPDETATYDYDSEEDDGFEDCECGYTHHHEDKCPTEKQCEKYVKWRKDE